MAQQPKSFGRRQEGGSPAPEAKRAKGGAPPNAGKIVALIATPLVVAFAAGMYFLFTFLMEARDELDAYIEPMLTEMVASRWSDASLQRYAGPDLKRWLRERNATGALLEFNSLGPIVRYEGVKEFEVKMESDEGSAQANVVVEFESGVQKFFVELQRVDGRWTLLTLRQMTD